MICEFEAGVFSKGVVRVLVASGYSPIGDRRVDSDINLLYPDRGRKNNITVNVFFFLSFLNHKNSPYDC